MEIKKNNLKYYCLEKYIFTFYTLRDNKKYIRNNSVGHIQPKWLKLNGKRKLRAPYILK